MAAEPIDDIALWLSRIQAGDDADLRRYVHERLSGVTLDPPLDTRSLDQPQLFLQDLYEHADSATQKRLRSAIAELLVDLLRPSEQDQGQPAPYVSRLLRLCERFSIDEAKPAILALIMGGALFS